MPRKPRENSDARAPGARSALLSQLGALGEIGTRGTPKFATLHCNDSFQRSYITRRIWRLSFRGDSLIFFITITFKVRVRLRVRLYHDSEVRNVAL